MYKGKSSMCRFQKQIKKLDKQDPYILIEEKRKSFEETQKLFTHRKPKNNFKLTIFKMKSKKAAFPLDCIRGRSFIMKIENWYRNDVT